MPDLAGSGAGSWIALIVLGGLAGTIGQILRVLVGLKKTWEKSQSPAEFKATFSPMRLVVSILIGAAAGAVAAISTLDGIGPIGRDRIFALIGAGYAGADFLESALRKSAS